jgi:TPR repeat protein
VKWHRKAADQRYAPAQSNLGWMYANGEGVPKDSAEALKWYRKAADQGYAPAQHTLGLMYAKGEGVAKDSAEAGKWYRKVFDQGDAPAQSTLSWIYANGEGVPKDSAEAVKWYRKAADQGDAKAQCNLGVMYANGEGVPKDSAEAVKWYRKAADQGITRAEFNLGLMYANGEGVPKDSAEPVEWYRKVFDQGDAPAQCTLGLMYANGDGVSKDSAEAVKWYRKAADLGEAQAQLNLGWMYANGEGVPKDSAEGLKWYRKAADQGYPPAQYTLGSMCQEGEGMPKDVVEAYKWFNLAAGSGHAQAADCRRLLESRMTAGQIREAQRLSRESRPQKRTSSDNDPGKVGQQAGALDRARGTGSGFIVTTDGYLVTSAHVFGESTKASVVTETGTLPAIVVRLDPGNDLALLKVNGSFSPLPVISSRSVKLGEPVFTVGFPNPGLQGFSPKFSKGEISSLSGLQDDPRHFQISVPVQPGSSGGPLVDCRGNVVGVVEAKLSAGAALVTSGALPENVNYAVKSSFLTALLESLPAVNAKLAEPSTKGCTQEEIARTVQSATVLVVVE